MSEKRKKKFKLFDLNRDGPGVSKDEKPFVPNLKSMPKYYFRHFSKVLSINFPMLPLWLIPLAALYLYITAPTTPSQADPTFSTLIGSYMLSGDTTLSSLFGVFGLQVNLPVFTPARIWGYIGLAALLALLWGFIHVGSTYCSRSMLRGEPVFVWSDFLYAAKRNFKQALLIGFADLLFVFMLVFDFIYFSRMGGSFMLDVCFFGICALIILYLLMRPYIYLMIITFDMKFRKILKNALIFSILGIGRNLMGFLGIVVLVIINVLLLIVLWPLGVVVPLILPLFYLLPSIQLFSTYAAYPVIEKYMIEPVLVENEEDEPSGDEELADSEEE